MTQPQEKGDEGGREGYLLKLEPRPLTGPVRRKYWFVLAAESHTLYWFKQIDDFNFAGRVSLGGAAFTFNPRDPNGRFEIHVDSKVYILEASSNQSRMEWLHALQQSRRRYHEREAATTTTSSEIPPSMGNSPKSSTAFMPPSQKEEEGEKDKSSTTEDTSPRSTFYLNAEGELTTNSFEVPPPQQPLIHTGIRGLDDLLTVDEPIRSALSSGSSTKKVIEVGRQPVRTLSQSGGGGGAGAGEVATAVKQEKCPHCGCEAPELVEQMRSRCFELTDELIAKDDLLNSLKRAVVSAHNQRDALARLCADSSGAEEKLGILLERESALASMQFTLSELRSEKERLLEENRRLESENSSLQTTVEAFQQSVRTKDELILKYCGDAQSLGSHRSGMGVVDIDVPEGILVDFGGTPTDTAAKSLFDEANVEDVSQLKDLVDGYCNQNAFLNAEVLELQKIVQSLEDRERRLIRQNFTVEAVYYQLKSRYIMVLNHFRSASQPRRLDPALINDLIEEVSRPHSPLRSINKEETGDGPSTSASASSLPYGLSSAISISKIDSEVDSLGFYLSSPQSRHSNALTANLNSTSASGDSPTPNDQPPPECASPDWLMNMAADFKKRSEDIWQSIERENNKEYIEWLQKWDGFLVNHVLQPIPSQNTQLKALVRCGVPHAYRNRVWKSLVQFHVSNTKAETGKGYYECLLRKAEKAKEEGSEDAAIKQIDLDLIRTLPTNKLFESDTSEKVQQLKNILYAFRFHNKAIGYCQGLNRLAAIGLLYLGEIDAFWFLVACVEYLQPPDYYTPSLMGAVVDQKVLMDLVQDKLPTLWAHLLRLEVDLSLFTLSWFITAFVDVLNHSVYTSIFDVFLCEGNKVLFRFALALLKFCESQILKCTSLSGVHACLSNLSSSSGPDFRTLANIAFNSMNPFPTKAIEHKRQLYTSQFKSRLK